MSWYKITLPFAEAGGKAKELQTAFETLFKANQAPKNAAMFTSRDESFSLTQFRPQQGQCFS